MSQILKMSEIPHGIQTGHLREVQSNVEPVIRREGDVVVIPIFVREVEIVEDEDIRVGYVYFEAPVAYNGQNLEDYDTCCRQSYAGIREYLYGDWKVQNEQILKSTFTAHQYAVREAFPKYDGDVPKNVVRFEEIRQEFWAAVMEILTILEKTPEDLPEGPISSEQMIAWALENGMTSKQMQSYIPTFQNISLNLLHNGRNWDELFPMPAAV